MITSETDTAGSALQVPVPVYLYPGRLFAAREPHVVTTILGSCVSVCLWDPRLRAGGINHFLMPDFVDEQEPSPRFGTVAVERLIGELVELGSAERDLKAKVFGGSHVLGTGNGVDRSFLGVRNFEVARIVLEEHGIPIVAKDVGGLRGRKLVFHTADGSVHIRKL